MEMDKRRIADAVVCRTCGYVFGVDGEVWHRKRACPACSSRSSPAIVPVEYDLRPSRGDDGRFYLIDSRGDLHGGIFRSPQEAIAFLVAAGNWRWLSYQEAAANDPLFTEDLSFLSDPNAAPGPPPIPRVARETVPALPDRLDVLLAIWIAQSIIGGD